MVETIRISRNLGALLLAFMLVYLLHWVSGESLSLWECFGVVGAALTIVSIGLYYFRRPSTGETRFHLTPAISRHRARQLAGQADNVSTPDGEWIWRAASTGRGRATSRSDPAAD